MAYFYPVRMALPSNERKFGFLIHLVAGVGFVFIPFISSPFFPHFGRILHIPHLQCETITYLFLLGFFYLHYYWLIPNFLFRNRYTAYVVYVIGGITLCIVLPSIIIPPPAHPPLPPPPPLSGPPPPPRLVGRLLFNHHLYLSLLVYTFSLLLRFYSRWKNLRQEKAQTELLFLKTQINPHFLFNTLNGVYSLCIDEKAGQSASAVLKLSDMMRYVLVDSRQDFVDIEKEMDYVKSFIELQQLRFGNTVTIDFTLEGAFVHQKIAPILLIPFIENAFKYGVNPEQESTIGIHLQLKGTELRLEVRNKKVVLPNNGDHMGIGIDNTLKRMELLYPNRYQLVVDDQQDFYRVLLLLSLS